MSTTDRNTIRQALITLLQGVGTISEVKDGLASALGGATPVVSVVSDGTARVPSGHGETQPDFYINLFVYVLLFDANGAAYDEADAEAKGDTVEHDIAALVIANQQTATWQNIQYAGRSKKEPVIMLDGFVYARETIPLLVECDTDE